MSLQPLSGTQSSTMLKNQIVILLNKILEKIKHLPETAEITVTTEGDTTYITGQYNRSLQYKAGETRIVSDRLELGPRFYIEYETTYSCCIARHQEIARVKSYSSCVYVDYLFNDEAIDILLRNMSKGNKYNDGLEMIDPPHVEAEEKGCFIATAVYGCQDAPEVLFLRRYRDTVLSVGRPGKLLIRWYYLLSPAIARWLTGRKLVSRLVRTLLLDNLVNALRRRHG